MEKVEVIRKEHFNAAHRLHNPNWTDEKNISFYGKCNNPNYHGHNYDLEVTRGVKPLRIYSWIIYKCKMSSIY